ncbi:MAG: HAD family hydrolase, partial [Thermoguttaceae bacterium]
FLPRPPPLRPSSPIHQPARTSMAIRFIFFDLGKVLVNFDLNQMLRQVSEVAGVSVECVAAALFDDHWHRNFEMGQFALEEYHRGFCERIGCQPDLARLHRAATEFFELNVSILPVISGLRQTRFPLGILSNTCVTHWDYCCRRFALVRECFPVAVTSYEARLLKPQKEMYDLAARRAGVAPGEIFFTDDLLENVEGARAAGWDAVQFTGARQLASELRTRGVPMNL